MDRDIPTDAHSSEDPAEEAAAYESPAVQVIGSVEELTQGVGAGVADASEGTIS